MLSVFYNLPSVLLSGKNDNFIFSASHQLNKLMYNLFRLNVSKFIILFLLLMPLHVVEEMK